MIAKGCCESSQMFKSEGRNPKAEPIQAGGFSEFGFRGFGLRIWASLRRLKPICD
jgi:hypothetical protein